jgi:hypothetical protein
VPLSPDGRRDATSHGLMGPRASCPHSTSWSLRVVIMVKKLKIIFLLHSGAHFSVFLSQSPVQWQGYHSGQIWPAPRVLVYLASGLLLVCHSFFIVPKTPVPLLEQDLLSQVKLKFSSPRQLSLLPPPSETNRSHNVNWWDKCRASLDGPSLFK